MRFFLKAKNEYLWSPQASALSIPDHASVALSSKIQWFKASHLFPLRYILIQMPKDLQKCRSQDLKLPCMQIPSFPDVAHPGPIVSQQTRLDEVISKRNGLQVAGAPGHTGAGEEIWAVRRTSNNPKHLGAMVIIKSLGYSRSWCRFQLKNLWLDPGQFCHPWGVARSASDRVQQTASARFSLRCWMGEVQVSPVMPDFRMDSSLFKTVNFMEELLHCRSLSLEQPVSCFLFVWTIWWSPEIGVPPNHPFLFGVFHYKPSILDIPTESPISEDASMSRRWLARCWMMTMRKIGWMNGRTSGTACFFFFLHSRSQ